jgi:hypothetical protein
MSFYFNELLVNHFEYRKLIKNKLFLYLFVIAFSMEGFFFGMIALNFTEHWADQAWPTNMMRERGLPRVAWVGTLVAFPSGCAVAISLLSGNEASLVGVAISVSLLPPAVNTVIHLILILLYYSSIIRNTKNESLKSMLLKIFKFHN